MISVIVPVYNKEEYLDKCIQSILSQTYGDLEIILIDDGSTDGSFAICKKYEKNDNRIIVVHTKNYGVSHARNCGIKKASGDKIIFIDADDCIKRNYIEVLNKYREDLVVSGLIINGVKNMPKPLTTLSKSGIIARKNAKFITVPYCKLYNLEKIKANKIYFDEEMNFGEDTCFVLDYLNVCNTIRFIDYAGYYNNIIDGTLSRKYIKNADEQLNKIYRKIKKTTRNIFTRCYWKIRNYKIIIDNRMRIKENKK